VKDGNRQKYITENIRNKNNQITARSNLNPSLGSPKISCAGIGA
jgi:hypothetical protein